MSKNKRKGPTPRRRHDGPTDSSSHHAGPPQDLVTVLFAAAHAAAGGDVDAAERCALSLLTGPLGVQAVQVATVAVVADGLLHSWRRGWQPIDLWQVTRRRLAKEHVGVLVAVHAAAMQKHAAATVDPRWLDQLDDLGARCWWPSDSNALRAWEQADRQEALLSRRGKGPGDATRAVTVAIELLALLVRLPKVEKLVPLPGDARPHAPAAHGPVDQKVLAKVRALLAKAESTEFEEEAEALSAKAQELMTRHSLERLLVESVDEHVEPASACRIWLDAPYATAKSLLVQAVAQANRSTAVWSEGLGFSTVVGDERDLVATELIVTSLLVQATRAMLHPSHRQDDRQRSFRQAFLVAYASRIGERLRGANADTAADLQASTGADLVPVLAAHEERIDAARSKIFPNTRSTVVSVSNGYGYAAGRAAADQAVLPTAPELAT